MIDLLDNSRPKAKCLHHLLLTQPAWSKWSTSTCRNISSPTRMPSGLFHTSFLFFFFFLFDSYQHFGDIYIYKVAKLNARKIQTVHIYIYFSWFTLHNFGEQSCLKPQLYTQRSRNGDHEYEDRSSTANLFAGDCFN